jgi:hypothetical protein
MRNLLRPGLSRELTIASFNRFDFKIIVMIDDAMKNWKGVLLSEKSSQQFIG